MLIRFATTFLFTCIFTTLAFASSCGGNRPIPFDSFTGILALTWENGFCELRADTPKGLKSHPECKGRTKDDQFARRFALHGLWPSCDGTRKGGPRSCPIQKFNYDLGNKKDLLETFPTLKLAKHEWRAHGGCFGGKFDDDLYFGTSARLFEDFDNNPITKELSKLVGQIIPAGTIEALFDIHFGKGIGDKVTLICKLDQISKDRHAARMLILTEIQLNLASTSPLEDDLKTMMQNSNWIDQRAECDGAILDRVGNQYFY